MKTILFGMTLLMSISASTSQLDSLISKIYDTCPEAVEDFTINQVCTTSTKNVYFIFGSGSSGGTYYPTAHLVGKYIKLTGNCQISNPLRFKLSNDRKYMIQVNGDDSILSIPGEGGIGYHKSSDGKTAEKLKCSAYEI